MNKQLQDFITLALLAETREQKRAVIIATWNNGWSRGFDQGKNDPDFENSPDDTDEG